MAMNIERLRVFLAVYECSSMTAAAARLGITQPAVSQSVRELEDEVGAELFIRGRKGIVPTRQADRFWEVARRAVRAFEAAEHESKRLRQPARTTLRLGSTFAPSLAFMPRAMAAFADSQQDVLPSLRVLEGDTLAASLRVDGFDLAVIDFEPTKLDLRHFETQLLFHDPIVLVESTSADRGTITEGRLTASGVGGLPLLLPPLGSMSRTRVQDALERAGVDATSLVPRMELGSAPSLLAAATAGLGVAFISRLAADPFIARGELAIVAIDGVTCSAPVSAIRPRDTVASEVADSFWGFLPTLSYLTADQRRIVRSGDSVPPSSRRVPPSTRVG